MIKSGKIFRLKFPGLAARVIDAPAGCATTKFPHLVESLILRSRWYVNEQGEPNNHSSPALILPDYDRPRPVRMILATPFYVLALIFELLSAGTTALAARIAGDPR